MYICSEIEYNVTNNTVYGGKTNERGQNITT